MEFLLFALVLLGGLVLVPLGLPGLWVMVAAGVVYASVLPDRLSIWTVLAVTVLAVIAEVIEFTLASRYARKYGGSRRAGWGAMIGGIVGAVVGVPVPIVGPVIGAFIGAFAGALVFEVTAGSTMGASTRVATGALIGRVTAAAVKVAIGCVMVAWLLAVSWF
jgi:uncharacterized protein